MKPWLSTLLFYGFVASASQSGCFNLSTTPEEFSSIEFDYIVIGSGAGGLPVAVRLSEDENMKVGIIEAGYLHLGDPLIDMPGKTGLALGNPDYDWSFVSIPQKNALGRQVPQPRGKMLGGSTGLNYLGWDRASKVEYDSWAKFVGDEAYAEEWDYDGLLPYFKRSEMLSSASHDPITLATSSEEDIKMSEDESQYGSGYEGAVEISYYTFFSDLIKPWLDSWRKLGIPVTRNAFNGTTIGARVQRNSLERNKGTRSYAASGYLCPASRRKNLFVVQGAQATKLLLKNSTTSAGSIVKGTGVVFSINELLYGARIKPSGEIIVAAGALATPQILELSGIGNPKVLSKYGIRTKVDLPGVGENLIDQIFVPSQFKLKEGFVTFDNLNDPTFLEEQTALYNKNGSGALASGDCTVAFHPLKAFMTSSQHETVLSNLQKAIKTKKETSDLTALQAAQYSIMEEWLKNGNVPQAELVLFQKGYINPTEGNNYMTMASGIQHPFSRGSVHIGSSDPFSHPLIDPNYLDFEYDVSVLIESTKLALKLAEQEPLAEIIAAKEFPPATSDEDIDGWARMTIITGSHPIGTTAMAPRSMGGVVDSTLKVYGTSNIRVADASIIPMSIAAHTQATVYAIGEKAADIIKCSRAANERHGIEDLLSPR